LNTVEHVKEISEKDPQHRFEIVGNRIRARAGHRFHVEVPQKPILPPSRLYHGTCDDAIPGIKAKGILRMGKSYVHLSDTTERAHRIGLRKSKNPVILEIRAADAAAGGVRFWRSGQISSDGEIFLSDEIPPSFINILEKGNR
jgi:putative RNA 2'-phosphotransferase